jgi:predicted ATP-dependent endonuclease of OLD family
MLNKMRLRNLRSFSNTDHNDFVELKPLTIFIGKNSSGKSTFLRSLPLLRQSIEARTTGPILWYGAYVDFGAFSEAIKHGTSDKVIYFDFQLNLDVLKGNLFGYSSAFDFFSSNVFGREKLDVQIELGVAEAQGKTVAKSLRIVVDKVEYSIEFQNDGKCILLINGKQIVDNLSYLTKANFLPELGRIRRLERTIDGTKRVHKIWDEEFLKETFTNTVKGLLLPYFHPNTSEETILEGIDKLGICNYSDIEKNLSNIFKTSSSFKKRFIKAPVHLKNEIYENCIHKNLSLILSSINRELENTFKGIKYIAPLRATAERYYRHQDLQIEEIDHTGSNLAMLLKSWSHSENRNFSNWTKENFDFKVRVHEVGLHYALMIQTGLDLKEYNINDMGFGFSQILPIVASLWLETQNLRNLRVRHKRITPKQIIFAIEQPELHLHPAYQAKLATMFASLVQTAKKDNLNLVILFETHSKTMIDTIGDNIEDKIISKDDVNIVLFEKDENNLSQVKFSNYDENGYLENWPIGFFSGRD